MFAKSIDTASGGSATTGHMDRTDLNREKALSNFDVRHALSSMYSYELPFRARRRLPNALLRGWKTNGILTYILGAAVFGNPLVRCGRHRARNTEGGVGFDPNLPSAQRTASRWFNTAAFGIPRIGSFGNSGRNLFRDYRPCRSMRRYSKIFR